MTHTSQIQRALAVLILSALAGCTTGPDHKRPEIAVPADWPENEILDTASDADLSEWWRGFGDPFLDELVARALDDNLEIQIQAARVEEARARLGLARADRWPSLDAQADASRERRPGAALGIPEAGSTTTNLFSVSGMLSYEVDLWGRLAREREGAEALLRESHYARDAVRLNVAADVVTTYFDWRAARNQLAIARDTVESRAETLRLQEIRREGGDIDELALQQALSEWEFARAALPAREQRVRVLEGALSVLTGLEPAALWEETREWDARAETAKPGVPESVPAYLPSELLERRPDVRAAEAALHAATAGIGVAEAARLPRLNLSALLGTAATSAGDLFSDGTETWRLAGGFGGNLWDFGRNRARVETAEARALQAQGQYGLVVRLAFNEARDALALFETSGQRVEATRRLVAALERTEELAEIRYDEGFISFLERLDAQRALLDARLAYEDALRDQRSATATLFKALGGGWEAM
ncbi:MAG: efflux transporter outer membrane subunit [Opitutales bacterium]|nr:efflux transporter outer membrane subunit [Opitutales bacterium]